MINWAPLIFVLMLLGACQTSRKTAGASAGVTTPAANPLNACASEANGFRFSDFAGAAARMDGATYVLPVRYKAYRVNNAEVKKFMQSAKEAASGAELSVPLPGGCTPFALRSSRAITPDMAARYPDLSSLQGTGTADKAADIRLDFNGQALRGMVTQGGHQYLISPAVGPGSETLLLVYDKADAGGKKQPFEQQNNKGLQPAGQPSPVR